MKISDDQVHQAYVVAKRVYEKQTMPTVGANSLHKEHGLNVNSARDFIEDYKALRNGELFKRAMSAPAMAYFLSRIERDSGRQALDHALEALLKHITYYEGLLGVTLRKMRGVSARFSARLEQPYDYEQFQENFQQFVEASQGDTASARALRLKGAPIHPRRTTALITVYVRNPDVVAEVLERANGKCERCGHAAPFVRAKDGTPYLEVHHKTRLAEKGDDTVSNAMALCPNCHREMHYGASGVQQSAQPDGLASSRTAV